VFHSLPGYTGSRIKNQGETDVDCGGPCQACQAASAKLNGVDWTAVTITATNLGADLAIAGTTVDGKGFAFTAHANSVTGSYTIATGAFQMSTAATDQYAANVSGSVTLSKFDTNNKKVSGTFSFTATTFTGTPGALTNGTFTNVHYQ